MIVSRKKIALFFTLFACCLANAFAFVSAPNTSINGYASTSYVPQVYKYANGNMLNNAQTIPNYVANLQNRLARQPRIVGNFDTNPFTTKLNLTRGSDEWKAINFYTTEAGYTEINNTYRRGGTTKKGEIIHNFLKSSKTTKTTTLYRGYVENGKKLLYDKGFTSTSKNESVALGFANKNYYGEGKRVVEIMTVSKGTNAIDIDSLKGLSVFGNEKEVLLDRGIKRVITKEYVEDGITYRYTKAVPTSKARAMSFFNGVIKYAPMLIEVGQVAYEFYKIGQKYYSGQLNKQDTIIVGAGLAGSIVGGISGAATGSVAGSLIGSFIGSAIGGDYGAAIGKDIGSTLGGAIGGYVGAKFGNITARKFAKSVTSKYFPTLQDDKYFGQLCDNVDKYYDKQKKITA